MSDVRYISRFDDDFPDRLRFIPGCPSGIYVKGDLPDPDRKAVSIVGARACSEYGRKMAEYFASHLAAAGVQIISGMARGIDGIAQKAALEAGGRSFGILGSGVDIVYPEQNREIFSMTEGHGGLISEHPEGTAPRGPHFAARNRIISGLCDILLVIEARLKSGTSITVSNALEQGREIFAVPGRLTDGLSAGCNKLISEGAGAALHPDDILKALGLLCEDPVSTMSDNGRFREEGIRHLKLSDKEKLVYDCLDLYPKTVDEIVRTCYLPVSEVMEKLMKLCLMGAAKECARSNYIRII